MTGRTGPQLRAGRPAIVRIRDRVARPARVLLGSGLLLPVFALGHVEGRRVLVGAAEFPVAAAHHLLGQAPVTVVLVELGHRGEGPGPAAETVRHRRMHAQRVVREHGRGVVASLIEDWIAVLIDGVLAEPLQHGGEVLDARQQVTDAERSEHRAGTRIAEKVARGTQDVIQPIGFARVVPSEDVREAEGAPRQGQIGLVVEGEAVGQRRERRVEGSVRVAEHLVVGEIGDVQHVGIGDPRVVDLGDEVGNTVGSDDRCAHNRSAQGSWLDHMESAVGRARLDPHPHRLAVARVDAHDRRLQLRLAVGVEVGTVAAALQRLLLETGVELGEVVDGAVDADALPPAAEEAVGGAVLLDRGHLALFTAPRELAVEGLVTDPAGEGRRLAELRLEGEGGHHRVWIRRRVVQGDVELDGVAADHSVVGVHSTDVDRDVDDFGRHRGLEGGLPSTGRPTATFLLELEGVGVLVEGVVGAAGLERALWGRRLRRSGVLHGHVANARRRGLRAGERGHRGELVGAVG